MGLPAQRTFSAPPSSSLKNLCLGGLVGWASAISSVMIPRSLYGAPCSVSSSLLPLPFLLLRLPSLLLALKILAGGRGGGGVKIKNLRDHFQGGTSSYP